MKFWPSLSRGALLLLCGVLLSGCFQPPQSQLDEERESHFQTGKSRINAMDYPGAIDAFEKALEVNPHSASAHFELGWLFDQKEPDPAAAIYHYQQFLTLRPNAPNAEFVRQHILACKLQLAETVSLAPVTAEQQRELDRLNDENKQLRADNARLRQIIQQWQDYVARQQARARLAASDSARQSQSTSASAPGPASSPSPDRTEGSQFSRQRHTGPYRTHVVRRGDTLARIAREYGVSLGAIQAANPGLEPRRLLPGRTVRVPVSGHSAR